LPIPAERHSLAGQTALERAEFWTRCGCVAQAQAEFTQALREDEPAARVAFGLFLREYGDWSAAVHQFQQLLDFSRRRNNTRLQAIALNNLAVLHREAGKQQLAASFQQRSFAAESAGDKTGESGLGLACDLSNLANDALLAGEYRMASRLLTSALQLDVLDDKNIPAQAADWGSLGLANLMANRFADALRCLKKSLRLHRQLKDPRGMGCNLLHISQFWATLGAWSRAERHVERAIGILHGLPRGEIHEEAQAWLELTRRQRRVRECNPLCN
jgi:tetratricopeptide (TPR) repeat protein